jgi:hypothetical protein
LRTLGKRLDSLLPGHKEVRSEEFGALRKDIAGFLTWYFEVGCDMVGLFGDFYLLFSMRLVVQDDMSGHERSYDLT